MSWFIHFCDLFGVAVFAISGALMAGRKSMDLMGILVVAVITALGGGTLRDLLLDRPVGWVQDGTALWIAMLAALGTLIWVRLARPVPERLLAIADALGLAVFTVIGTDIALGQAAPPSTAVIMGAMTGAAGGVLRDIVCNEIPLIFQREIYATACILGSLLYLGLGHLPIPHDLAVALAMAVVLGVRLAAIRWHLSLPRASSDQHP